ncbi:hypothetical protein LSUE1_G003270 [Lachnellula suecica]|uniref:DUF7053 domain-containing protein n=1 Tax=Lachnellula suecica TaxID=602035 RepID=A0A8T9CCT8_9HELO|nr:hypothetical protein LSUE1_G003270 [Lachnellula suecica]
MSKRTVFTTLTPLPAEISREVVLSTLHDHLEMIDLNPLVEERHPIKPPSNSTAEEYHCQWYAITDRISYLPGGLASGKVTYNGCFHDLVNGLQTHVYAPMGLNIRGKWTLGGSLPGEPVAPIEMGVGAPLQGLWLREDVDMKCNIMMTSFVKKTLKKAHSSLVDRLVVKTQIVAAALKNEQLNESSPQQGPFRRTSTQYAQSTSDFGSESTFENHSPASPGLNPYPHQAPPPFEHPAFRERQEHDNSLYPKPLSPRISASWNDGMPKGRASYQDHMAGGQNAGARVSWQSLNHGGRSPSMQQMDPAFQQASAYHQRSSSQSHTSEGSAQGRWDGGRVDSNNKIRENGYPGPPPPPKLSTPVELE